MNKTIEKTTKSDEANVSRVAYELWENAGRPAGRDLEFWLSAEAKLRSGCQQIAGAPAVTISAAPAPETVQKMPRRGGNGARKSWPKPYPNLPKF
jgi:hypothetical protein